MTENLDLEAIKANRARQMSAVASVMSTLAGWNDGLMPSFTCSEAESLAELARAYGQEATADALLLGHAWHDDEGDAHLAVTIKVENTYATGHTSTQEHTICVPMPDPYPEEDGDDLDDWASDHLFPFTGDGHGGDALYEVTIVRASVDAFTGKKFEFGL